MLDHTPGLASLPPPTDKPQEKPGAIFLLQLLQHSLIHGAQGWAACTS